MSDREEKPAHRSQVEDSSFEDRWEFIRSSISRDRLRTNVVSEVTSLRFLRKNPATVSFLVLMGSIYLGQLYLAGSAAPEAAYTAIAELSNRAFVVLAPWLHSYHAHIVMNGFLFAIFGAWTERRVGSAQFAVVTCVAGYVTNFTPFIIGFGDLSVGASGITNALLAFFTLTQGYLYGQTVQASPIDYRMAMYRVALLLVGSLFVGQSIGEFFGYFTPTPGSAAGTHLVGVGLGLVWFLYRRAGPSVREAILQ